jgi:DNA polymerase III gamma/tau subunit
MLGIAPDQVISELIAAIQSGSASEVVMLLQSIREQGYQAGQLAKQLGARLRSYLLEGTSPIPSDLLTETLSKLLAVPTSHDQEAALELALIGIILRQNPVNMNAINAPKTEPVKEELVEVIVDVSEPTEIPQTETKEPTHIEKKEEPVIKEEKKPAKKDKPGESLNDSIWDDALQTIKQTHNTLYSVARMAKPQVDGNEIILEFGFAFHQKRLNEVKNKQIISDIVEKVAGRPVVITCIVSKSAATMPASVSPAVAATTSSDTLSTISNIFGGAEVLES